jgi:hypothetical protein
MRRRMVISERQPLSIWCQLETEASDWKWIVKQLSVA